MRRERSMVEYASFIGSILNFTDKIQQTMVLMQQERYCTLYTNII